MEIFKTSIKTFCRKCKGETLPKRFFIFKLLVKYQTEIYPNSLVFITFCSCATLELLMFPISLLKCFRRIFRMGKIKHGNYNS